MNVNNEHRIILFRDEYSWLSNFYPCTIEHGQFIFHSVEHAYVSEKSEDYKWKLKCTDKTITPGQIKRLGRLVNLKPNFDYEKKSIMRKLLDIKFSKSYLQEKLIETHPKLLIEGNFHNDKYWGYCLKTNSGENHLGKLLMEIRDELMGIKQKNKKLLKDFAK